MQCSKRYLLKTKPSDTATLSPIYLLLRWFTMTADDKSPSGNKATIYKNNKPKDACEMHHELRQT